MRPSSGARVPGIEGLRAIAACSILVFHTWLYADPSGSANLGRLDRFMPDLALGVTLFFTLSGFLLYRPFAAAILRGEPRPKIRRYFRNRALRILPAYWAILLICATVLGSALSWNASGQLVNGRLVDPGLIGRAALFVQGYFPDTILLGIGPAWSLAVEAVFYCLLPLLTMFAVVLARGRTSRSARRSAVLAPAILLLAVGLMGKATAAFLVPPSAAYAGWQQDWHSVIERSFFCQADLFAFGMALAVLHVDSQDRSLRLPRWWRSAALIGAVGAYAAARRSGDWQLSYSPRNTVIAAACALVLALVVLPADGVTRSRVARVLEARILVVIGVISYSIFLWHEPIVRWLDDQGLTMAGRVGFLVNLITVGAVTGVASMITYRLVEAPALRLKFHRGRAAPEPMPVAEVEAAP